MDQMTAPVVFPNSERDPGVAFHDHLPAQEETDPPDTLLSEGDHPEGEPPPVITGGTRMLE